MIILVTMTTWLITMLSRVEWRVIDSGGKRVYDDDSYLPVLDTHNMIDIIIAQDTTHPLHHTDNQINECNCGA